MLVLTRHVGQTICIGDNIRITIVKSRGAAAAVVGIDAPKTTAVVRGELLREAAAEKAKTA